MALTREEDNIHISLTTVNYGDVFKTFSYSYYFCGSEDPNEYEVLSDGWTLSIESFGGV